MQPGAVPLLHLFYRLNPTAKGSELGKFLLDCLQPFLPLAVSDLRLASVPVLTSVCLIQLLNVSDLRSQTYNLFSKNF
jgi:hypothetical protein